ncbi:MAG: lysophospholipid acyltransferase family protein [Acidobacteria bacterium]|nr:lysophospholipid acyltransferase family protein [Acidobacteriota bacterium]
MLHSQIPGMNTLRGIYATIRTRQDEHTIGGRLLQQLRIRFRASPHDLTLIPRSGPAILLLNHPTGLLEGAVLMEILHRIRPDAKFLANNVLSEVPELHDSIIPVDITTHAPQHNSAAIKRATKHLANGGLLVVFPAGEVSSFHLRNLAISDPAWHPSIARIIELANRRSPNLQVVPAFITGTNSFLFQCAGVIHPSLRTLLLVRELLNKQGTEVELRIGRPIPAARLADFATDGERIQYLRWRTDLLASRHHFKPQTNFPLKGNKAAQQPVRPPIDTAAIASEIAQLDPLIATTDLTAYLAPANRIPNALQEIGRLREITFRAAGEGTGKTTDIDAFDQQYLHLFLWNHAKQEIAGAYRLAATDVVHPLYTSTLFRYGPEFLQTLGPALELGRSFVRMEYQKSFAPLLLLWKGIGRYVADNPRYKVLFGPVSISNRYQSLSRDLMIGFLERYAQLPEWKQFVQTRNPFRRSTAQAPDTFIRDIDQLSDLVNDIEASRDGVPVLLRQYLKLGGKLLAFNVDEEFSNVVDGLIVVDLTRTEPCLLERYLGKRSITL